MSLFNRLVAASLPVIPKPIVGMVSRRYIAGERLEDAVRVVKELNAEGAAATVDVLGEDTTERQQAEQTVAEYRRVIAAIVENGLDCNISIKLTALGLNIDDSFCRDNVRTILEEARAHDMFVRIDMEDSSVTSSTLDIFRHVQKSYGRVGAVLQAYLRRTLRDVRELLAGPPLNIRLCKGIYNEPPEVAFKDPEVVRRSYAYLLQVLLGSGAYVGIATHDQTLLYEGLRVVDEMRLPPEKYEFQMLLGVIPETRRTLIREGHRLRVYVPFGKHWYGYSTRRLRENPKVAGYVMKAMFSRS